MMASGGEEEIHSRLRDALTDLERTAQRKGKEEGLSENEETVVVQKLYLSLNIFETTESEHCIMLSLDVIKCVVTSFKAVTQKHLSQICSFLFNIIGLRGSGDVQVRSFPTTETKNLVPIKGLNPEKVAFNTKLPVYALQVLHLAMKSAKKSQMFSFWYAFLPKSTFSPYKNSVSDFMAHSNLTFRTWSLTVIQEFFGHSKTFLTLAESKCRFVSFIPVSLALADSIHEAHLILLRSINPNMPLNVCTVALKTLTAMVVNCPYKKLKPGLLFSTSKDDSTIIKVIKELIHHPNPVVQIAILTLSASVCIVPHQEIHDSFDDLFDIFVMMGFPSCTPIDNNGRYVAMQNLGLLASAYIDPFCSHIHKLLSHVEASLNDRDMSIVLHTLRFIKMIGKSSQTIEQGPNLSQLLLFWSEILKPKTFQIIEDREWPTLKAAFCDCISEIGENVFDILPTDRRLLCVTYLLNHCSSADGRGGDDNAVSSSALRGVGMLVTYQSTGSAFLIDTATRLLLDLDEKTHRKVVITATWALANLSDSLAKQMDEELTQEFPPPLVLQLLEKTTVFAVDPQCHMNIKANCVRSIGSLLKFFDPTLFDADVQNDLRAILDTAINGVLGNITTGKLMKVRWNACYAAGSIFKNKGLYNLNPEWHKTLLRALLPLIDEFPNFKVRIGAAAAITSVSQREIIGKEYTKLGQTLMTALESARNIEIVEEIQHKADLIDQLCLTLCHVICLGDRHDLMSLDACVGNFVDSLEVSFKNCGQRISPEKASVIIDAESHLEGLLGKEVNHNLMIKVIKSSVL